MTLEPESELIGRVTDPEGRPVRMAMVRVADEELAPGWINGTDGAGRFHLMMLRPGVVELEIYHDDYGRQRRQVELVPGEQYHEFVLTALDRAALAGVVVDRGGAPVAGAPVRLVGLQHGREHATVTDAAGAFALRDLPVGEYSVSFGGRLYPDAGNRRVVLGGGEERFLAIRAVEPCSLSGQIYGVAPEDLHLLVAVAVSRLGTLPLPVDGGGAFALPSLPPGDWEIQAATHGDRRSATASVRCEDADALTAELAFPEGVPEGG